VAQPDDGIPDDRSLVGIRASSHPRDRERSAQLFRAVAPFFRPRSGRSRSYARLVTRPIAPAVRLRRRMVDSTFFGAVCRNSPQSISRVCLQHVLNERSVPLLSARCSGRTVSLVPPQPAPRCG
jgi:hypothetical protein